MASGYREGACAYCGTEDYVTDDHVPPKCLFPKPRPKLVTVPACEKCNGGFSKDDEYFRDFFAGDERSIGNPDRDAVFPLVQRSLQRPQASGKRISFEREISRVVRGVPGSGLLRFVKMRHASGKRLEATAARIATGLFMHHKGYRLPGSYKAFPFALHKMPLLEARAPEASVAARDFIRQLGETKPYSIGSAFQYRWKTARSGFNVTFWHFTIYGLPYFMVQTFPVRAKVTDTPPNDLIRLDRLRLEEFA